MKKILITAGPTYERIDPVRFIGNFSTGKMGFALAQTCAERGFQVILIAGPVSLTIQHQNVTRINVESAAQMYQAVMEQMPQCDGAILCAAVADFTPVQVADHKVKRGKEGWNIELKPTNDIAAAVGAAKREEQFLVGFALETNDEESNALQKMRKKNFNFIVLNSLNDANACFGFDTNKITILHADGKKELFPLKTKQQVAADIVERLPW